MPSEERSIIFNFEEIATALNAFSQQIREKYLPPGEIVSVSAKKAEAGLFVFQIQCSDSKKIEYVELSEGLVAASLLMYCMGARIPIRKAAKKTIEVGVNSLILKLN